MPPPKYMNVPGRPEANQPHDERWRWWTNECNAFRLAPVSFTGDETFQYKAHNITIITFHFRSVCNHVMEHTDDVSCLREQGAQRFANA